MSAENFDSYSHIERYSGHHSTGQQKYLSPKVTLVEAFRESKMSAQNENGLGSASPAVSPDSQKRFQRIESINLENLSESFNSEEGRIEQKQHRRDSGVNQISNLTSQMDLGEDEVDMNAFATPRDDGLAQHQQPDVLPMSANRRNSVGFKLAVGQGNGATAGAQFAAPPGFVRSRYNSRSHGTILPGPQLGFDFPDQGRGETFQDDDFYRSRRRVTMGDELGSLLLSNDGSTTGFQRDELASGIHFTADPRSQRRTIEFAPDFEIPEPQAEELERRGKGSASRRHSSPPRQPPVNVARPQYLLEESEQMGQGGRLRRHHTGESRPSVPYNNHLFEVQDLGINAYAPFSPGLLPYSPSPVQPYLDHGNPWAQAVPQDWNSPLVKPLQGNAFYPHNGYVNQGPGAMGAAAPQRAVQTPPQPRQRYSGKPRQTSPVINENSSSILQEYRASGVRPPMHALKGHVLEFSKDSHGSRFIQFKMETASPEERKMMIDEILPEAVELAGHPFGNYVVQNFILHASFEHREALGEAFLGKMLRLSSQTHGCRVVQYVLEMVTLPLRNKLIAEIIANVHVIAKNNHGTHVVQKGLGFVLDDVLHDSADVKLKKANEATKNKAPSADELLTMVEDSVLQDFLRLSTHPHAYRLVQLALADCKIERSKNMASLMALVEEHSYSLAIDQHGNFILQHVLDNGSVEQAATVQRFVASRVLELAQHKFGSHLVEKCLQTATKAQVSAIIGQIMKPSEENLKYFVRTVQNSGRHDVYTKDQTALLLLSKDPYANFVIQRAFDQGSAAEKAEMSHEIRRRAEVLARFTYGRHILSHINRAQS